MALPLEQLTSDDFDRFIELRENEDRLFEFIGGEIVEVPSNPYSSNIGGWVQTHINLYLMKNPIGFTTGEAGLYVVSGERYAPDVAFISRERQAHLARRGANPNPPNLAVEVISPTDDLRKFAIKLSNYLAAGTVVWAIFPDERQVVVHIPGKPAKIYGLDDVLDGGDVLPRFSLAVKDIFVD